MSKRGVNLILITILGCLLLLTGCQQVTIEPALPNRVPEKSEQKAQNEQKAEAAAGAGGEYLMTIVYGGETYSGMFYSMEITEPVEYVGQISAVTEEPTGELECTRGEPGQRVYKFIYQGNVCLILEKNGDGTIKTADVFGSVLGLSPGQVTSLSEESKKQFQEVTVEYLTVEDTFRRATDLVSATCIGIVQHSRYIEYQFSVEELHKGIAEDRISVFHTPKRVSVKEIRRSYKSKEYDFVEGSTYLLALEHNDYRYALLGDLVIPISDLNMASIYQQSAKKHLEDPNLLKSMEALCTYLKQIK